MIRPTCIALFVISLLVGVLSACSTSPDPRLYILEPMHVSGGSQTGEGLSIVVGPVTLPAHLDHKGIVTRDQRYRVNAAKFDRWAEPLDQNIVRVLCDNLSALIPSNQIIAYPRQIAHDVDYTVRIRITEFGTNPDGEVVLNVAWMLHDKSNAPVKAAKTRYSVNRRGDDVVAVVEAMSQAVERLSRDISNAIVSASAD